MARKPAEDAPPPGAPAWMATFSDMMTLILVFFVLLFSMSSVDAQKFQALVQNLGGVPDAFDKLNHAQSSSGAPGFEFIPESDIEADEYMDSVDDWEMVIAAVANNLGEWRNEGGSNEESGKNSQNADGITISATDMEIIINVSGDVLFRSADDAVLPDAKPLILGIMDKLVLPELSRGTVLSVRIEGHTDRRQIPPQNTRFHDNWDLSQARSLSVFRFISQSYPELDSYIREGRFANLGWGEFRPMDDALGDTEEDYARNRRVAFVMTKNPDLDNVIG